MAVFRSMRRIRRQARISAKPSEEGRNTPQKIDWKLMRMSFGASYVEPSACSIVCHR